MNGNQTVESLKGTKIMSITYSDFDYFEIELDNGSRLILNNYDSDKQKYDNRIIKKDGDVIKLSEGR